MHLHLPEQFGLLSPEIPQSIARPTKTNKPGHVPHKWILFLPKTNTRDSAMTAQLLSDRPAPIITGNSLVYTHTQGDGLYKAPEIIRNGVAISGSVRVSTIRTIVLVLAEDCLVLLE